MIGARSLEAATPGFNSVSGQVPREMASRDLPRVVPVMSEDQLYLVNLTAREVKHVPLPDPVVAVTMVYESRKSDDDTDDVSRVVVRRPKHIVVLDQEGNTLRTLSIPAELAGDAFSVSLPVGNEVILHKQERDETEPRENDLYWIDPDDKVVRHEKFTLRGSRDMTAVSIFMAASALPSPAVLTVIGYLTKRACCARGG